MDMNPNLRDVPKNMLRLGLGALAHANWHAHYNHINESAPDLSVLQAAHAAEILIKARIAEEHPLLIFDKLPKASQSADGLLGFEDLFADARTVQYADLPARLWAVTGMNLEELDLYQQFGRLRNAIQHFTAPPVSRTDDVSRFIYGVIDPFIHKCWGLYAIDYNEDDPTHQYVMEALVQREVLFLVSPSAAQEWGEYVRDPQEKDDYLDEMERRVALAKSLTAGQRGAD
jgi:hypothetical protein